MATQQAALQVLLMPSG